MFDIYFVHGWGFDKSFWFPAAKYVKQNNLVRSLFYIDLNFFDSNSKNTINTNSTINIFVTHSYGLHWFLEKKIDCVGLLNFFSAPSFIDYQKNPKKAKIYLDLMIKKFEKSPHFVLKEFYKNCGVTKNKFIKKINTKKLLKSLKDLRLKNYKDDFLYLSDKILNVFATDDQIFDLSIQKFDSLMSFKKKYMFVKSNNHAYPYLQPKETAIIINNYLKNLRK